MTGQPTPPRATVIIVNFDGIDSVPACLDSVLAAADTFPVRVVVVDNASTDGSRQYLENRTADDQRVTFVAREDNLGYAAAVNSVLDLVHSDYLAILNMDTVVDAAWLEPLVDFLDRNPRVGAVNPLLALADGRHVNAVGQDIHVSGIAVGRDLGKECSTIERSPVSVGGLQGAALVIRRALLVELGGMNASGFLYHEDVNLSWLLRLTGWELSCLPVSVVRHHYRLCMYPQKLHYLERNRLALLATYPRVATLLLVSPWLVATELMVWLYAATRGPRFLTAKLRSYRWVVTQRRELLRRRVWAQKRRQVGDWKIIRQLRFAYPWAQFMKLNRQRSDPCHRDPPAAEVE